MVMRNALPTLAIVLCASATLAGCNGVLGINAASLEDAGVGPAPMDTDSLTCANYCNVITQNCAGEYEEYLPDVDGGTGVCTTICGLLNPGTAAYPYPGMDPPIEDTLACRLWHAHSAGEATPGSGPSVHCRHAGPLGSTLCGGPIEPFCNIDWRFCVDDNSVASYPSTTACTQTLSAALAADGGFYLSAGAGDVNDETGAGIESGNTLNCRLWHLETAIQEGDPKTHCPHTGYPSLAGSDTAGPCN
jgi:hypothetical protein